MTTPAQVATPAQTATTEAEVHLPRAIIKNAMFYIDVAKQGVFLPENLNMTDRFGQAQISRLASVVQPLYKEAAFILEYAKNTSMEIVRMYADADDQASYEWDINYIDSSTGLPSELAELAELASETGVVDASDITHAINKTKRAIYLHGEILTKAWKMLDTARNALI